LTPPPASIARFATESIAPGEAVTSPVVISLRLETFATLNEVLDANVMRLVDALPSCNVVAFKRLALVVDKAKAELDAPPITKPRPVERGEISIRPLFVAASSAFIDN
jgi:hypothetical protein